MDIGIPLMQPATMKERRVRGEAFLDLSLSEIGEGYGRLRMIHPGADAAMLSSLRQYGQLTPVVVCRGDEERYELIDGFKRLRAARQLHGFTTLKARCLDGSTPVCKAAMVQLNGVGQSMGDMEEALVVYSLHREDGLTQVEIATLLGRHKSWVCRRIALIERLSDETQEHIRLGLVGASIGRELAKLPRGNQEAALSAIAKHRLTCRETEKLVSALLSRPRWEHEAILRCPEAVLGEVTGSSPHPGDRRRSWITSPLYWKLLAMERCCVSVLQEVDLQVRMPLAWGDAALLRPVMVRAIEAAERSTEALKQVLSCGSVNERF